MIRVTLSVIAFIITIGFVVGIHEAAHFLVARLLGIKVLKFSIGFGKPIYQWTGKTGIQYIIAMVPLGGYVKLLDEREGNVPDQDKHLAFNRQPKLKQLAVFCAGPFSNFLFAILIYWFVFMIGVVSVAPVIGKVLPGSIADQAGMQVHHQITSIDQRVTKDWTDVAIGIFRRIGDKGHMLIQTKSFNPLELGYYTLNLTDWKMDEFNPNPLASLGFVPETNVTKASLIKSQYSLIPALYQAYLETAKFTQLNGLIIGKLIVGDISIKSLAGPITIFTTAGEALNKGIVVFLGFLAFMSLSIGLINILPIPGLDGGHVLFLLIEGVIKKPIPLKVQNIAFKLSMIFIIFIFAQAFVNDVFRVFLK